MDIQLLVLSKQKDMIICVTLSLIINHNEIEKVLVNECNINVKISKKQKKKILYTPWTGKTGIKEKTGIKLG